MINLLALRQQKESWHGLRVLRYENQVPGNPVSKSGIQKFRQEGV